MTHREIPLKQWVHEEAQRQRCTVRAIRYRFYACKYHLKLRRVNQRVVFVLL